MHTRRILCSALLASLVVSTLWASGRSLITDAPAAETQATPETPPTNESPPLRATGSQMQRAPAALELEGAPPPSIARIRTALEQGDNTRALRAAVQLSLSSSDPRERDSAAMVAAWLHRARGRYNLASETFARISAGKGPLAELAAYYEAEADWRRRQHSAAIDTCVRYRKRWPKGQHAGDCLRILAHANASLGRTSAARDAARAYDEEHETGRITEQIELSIGMQLVEEDPAAAIPIFRSLAVEHGAALTGRVAEEQLERLAARGFKGTQIPTDPESRIRRALSLRESGRRDAAWEAFEQMSSARDPKIAAFVEEEADRFGWQTQRWPWLVDKFGGDYARTNDPALSWRRYSALARAGRFSEAVDYGLQMQKKHPTSRQWKRSEEELGRTMMLAGRYTEAIAQFDIAAGRGGSAGRRAAFSAAFCAFMAGDDAQAVQRLTTIAETDASSENEARYWRARAARRAGDTTAADSDIRWLVENDPWDWYTVLAQQGPDLPTTRPFARLGRWAGQPIANADPLFESLERAPLEGILASIVEPPADLVPGAQRQRSDSPRLALPSVVLPKQRQAQPAFASWIWGLPPGPRYVEPPTPVVLTDPERIPPRSYRPSPLWDPEVSRTQLRAFTEEYGSKWPELVAIYDLAEVGLYDLSGPMLSGWYESWRQAVRSRDTVARKLSGTAPEAWRELFLAARDHHNTARSIYAFWESQSDPALATEAWLLGYPLAHDQPVWENSRRYNLDPYLVLGLMRQESTYNSTAKSRVGARGAMQIMPKTGHLLADLAHDTEFDAGDLEDPTVAVSYGIRYLGLLIERFGGVYPLAIASYNGGPFNVSNWLSGTGKDVPVDVFVEHIPYRETRNYVKKVTSGYTAYIGLYAPKGAAVVLPDTPIADQREVVDF